MHISLTPELESRVKNKVESGLYNNASEVIREALRFMDSHEAWVNEIKLTHLRQELAQGLNDVEHSRVSKVESKQALDQLFEDLKQP